MNEELLPCPFCGSEAEFEYTELNEETGEGDDGMGSVRCTNNRCGANIYSDRDSAYEAWNKRSNA